MTASERLEHWFAEPLRQIEALKDCNAAFLAFMASFGLFERFIKAALDERDIKATPAEFRREAAATLGICDDVFDKFWGMYRDGIMHYLQPRVFTTKGVKYGWDVDASYGELPEFERKAPDQIIIRINPWKWSALTVRLWQERPDLLERLEKYPFGKVSEE